MYKVLVLVLTISMAISSAAQGQITIPTNDYDPAPGTELDHPQDLNADQTFYDYLTAGSGGPMTWDFSTRSFGNTLKTYSVSTASTPAIDSFPSANLSILNITSPDSGWAVISSVPSSFTILGTVAHTPQGEFVQTFDDLSPGWVFPISMNSHWIAHHHAKMTDQATSTHIYDSTFYNVDAYGTVEYQSKSVPCLRVKGEERIYTKVYLTQGGLVDSVMLVVNYVYFIASGFNSIVAGSVTTSAGVTYYSITTTNDFLGLPTSASEVNTDILPTGYKLSQNYPNPFNPSTEISLTVPTRSRVKLVIYDILGREVNVMVDETLAPGTYVSDWDGTDESGRRVSSGVYFYRMTAGDYIATKKMVLVK